MPAQYVCLFLLIFVVSMNHVSATPYRDEHPGKLLQSRGVQSLNNGSQLTDMMAFTRGLNQITHLAAYQSNKVPEYGFFGAMATFDAYGVPDLGKGDISGAQIWVVNSDSSRINKIMSGWEVNPDLYGDSKTHFFVYWTADGHEETGCYNLNCLGFVPVNGAPITPGDTLELPHGQTKMSLKIFKSQNDGDWWLYYGTDINNLIRVGYWPKTIFNTLAEGANLIAWGGMTISYEGQASPPMGNGQWAERDSASVQNVQYVGLDGKGYDPPTWPAGLRIVETHHNCYHATTFVDKMFHYGGPGGCH